VVEMRRLRLWVNGLADNDIQYFVEVAPNVDLTLIAAICVCLDERENEK
jgi:hypothetical protein